MIILSDKKYHVLANKTDDIMFILSHKKITYVSLCAIRMILAVSVSVKGSKTKYIQVC